MIARALGEHVGFGGRWVAGLVVGLVVGGAVSHVAGGSWPFAAGLVAMLAVVDTLKHLRGRVTRCPHCRERHRVGATVCPHCQHDL